MTKRKAVQGNRRSSPYPEMACSTSAGNNAPFSLRLPDDLRARARERASFKGVSIGQYVRALVEADLAGKAPSRRAGKRNALRQDLAQIHGAIIACGNQIGKMDCRCAAGQLRCPVREQGLELLKDTVSAVLLLARSIRGK